MAKEPLKNRLDLDDITRILRSLNPNIEPDPFGSIEDRLTEMEMAQEVFRELALEELDDIKQRTFGILILQIIKMIKFFFGLLPAGRVILIAIALVTLIVSLMEDGEISLDALKGAAAATGLGAFLSQQMAKIQGLATVLADETAVIGYAASDAFGQGAIIADRGLTTLQRATEDLLDSTRQAMEPTRSEIFAVRNDLIRQLDDQLQLSNMLANSDTLLGPLMRGLDDKIKALPLEAAKLVNLMEPTHAS